MPTGVVRLVAVLLSLVESVALVALIVMVLLIPRFVDLGVADVGLHSHGSTSDNRMDVEVYMLPPGWYITSRKEL
jgi:hypothetical protein